ncbi:MAG: hypothetical protein NT169_20930 [Chloroflexi bacterium]|nr:hypothetical protein [Chloroflexota bacterium]
MSGKRDLSLDVMRGLSIVFMVEIHSLIHIRPNNPVVYDTMRSLGALAAPFFLICAGMGIGYLQQRYRASLWEFRQITIRRGLFLILLSSVLGLSHLDATKILDWDIFTLIGAMYLLVALAGGIRWRGTLIGMVLVLLANLILPIGIPGILRAGSFPIIPFALYFLYGLILVDMGERLTQKHVANVAGSISASLVAIAVLAQGDRLIHVTRYDVWRTEGIAIIFAIFLLLLLLMRMAQARLNAFEKTMAPLTQLGRISLSLYYVQYFLLMLVPSILGRLVHREILILLPTAAWFIYLLGFLFFLYLLVVVWSRFAFKLSLEWFMHNYISRRSSFIDKA